ncbi:DUF5979 domain-containing protein [uncultured Leifsonia sp.]|uniref:DUF5979 domain-containing protein n=1 Tax=uncultured Leifsonia sp. TaxID=340359 RepID=UPI0028D6778D|nr:DUF5979 domain-containing protein [uncultured Leifsonia sp.]
MLRRVFQHARNTFRSTQRQAGSGRHRAAPAVAPRLRRLGPVAAATVLALVGGGLVAAPALAAGDLAAGGLASLSISKTVGAGKKAVTVTNGSEFTYTIAVGCDDNDCVDAAVTDTLPAEFAGFPIVETSVTPNSGSFEKTLTGCDAGVGADCELRVAFTDALAGGGKGLAAGRAYTISVTLRAPLNLTPSWQYAGTAVTNTAVGTSSTISGPVSSSADVTVDIPASVDIAVGKTWTPASQQFRPGDTSTVSLSAQNTSNVPATSLTLQDPAAAADGSTTLDAANPFAIVDFAGFGGVVLPQGATTVQVDAYVKDSTGAWGWHTGPPTAPAAIALPSGVAAADVAGLRFTFAGADGTALAAGGAGGSVGVLVAQRSTDRGTGAGLVTGAKVTNQVAGTVTVPDQKPVTKTASAPFAIGGLTVAVTAGKTIAPARIPAGTTATATISGKNSSNGTLDTLTLSDLDYFTDTLAFGGFAAGISYPAGATSGSVTWHFSDGSTQSTPFADGATPTAPAVVGAHLTGFELGFGGAIAAGTVATAQFLIAPTVDAAVDGTPLDAKNTLTVSGTNSAGTASKTASAPLLVFYPDISLTLKKAIQPTAPVSPGATVTVTLPATTSSDSAFVSPNRIVVEDVWREGKADDFFNAFDAIAVAPTQVLKGSTLAVEYTTDGGTSWQVLGGADATSAAQIYRSASLPAGANGLRFVFENAAGFPQGTSVTPAITAKARAELRDGSGETSTAGGGAKTYSNHAVAGTTGSVAGETVTGDEVTADADAKIQSTTGSGSLGISKKWTKTDLTGDVTDLPSQSAQQVGTRLGWGVTDTGYSQVVVADPATDPDTPASSVFQSFDLLKVSPISFTADPLLKWDTVTDVQLRIGGQWVSAKAPSGGWMNGSGFVGYTLTPQESAAATGVRLLIAPNDVARQNATDASAPPVGSGIATVAFGGSRPIGLVWQLRNVQRVPSDPANPWVTADTIGSITNTVSATGTQNGVPRGPVTDSDTVSLIDQPPAVDLTKTSEKSTIVVPHIGDVDPAGYPTNRFTLTAENTATSRASYIRVTDPSPCGAASAAACLSAADAWTADPFAGAGYSASNPFERLDVTKIGYSVPTDQVDADASRVTLWKRAADGTLSTSVVSLRAAAALSEADLADVVGVSVVYQGASPATTGGTIASGQKLTVTLDTRVRATARTSGDPVTAFRIDNAAFAQGYDPVLFPSGDQSRPFAAKTASLTLSSGALGITAAKSITPGSLLERDRTAPVAVTLTATPGAATVATNEVTITDDDAGFWNSFALTGLSAADVTLPSGADRVRVDVKTDGTSTWIVGTPEATATLPTTDVAGITGIRFTFLRADGGLFSRSAVPAGFTAKAVLHVQLLETARDGSAIAFPSTVTDSVQTASHRTDDPTVYADAAGSADAGIALNPGTHSLDVSKSPQGNMHTVTVGDTVPWTLTFANTGTGYLDLEGLTDTLPASLAWDGEAPVASTSAGGTLSASPAVSFDSTAGTIAFDWPKGGARMSPGERFTIVLGLILKPGLKASDRATNTMIVETAQTLTACTNASGNGQGTLPGLDATQCGTTNYVQPVSGPSLYTTKGVKGDVVDRTVSGAINPSDPTAVCRPDADGYYVQPCAANTVVGGTDEWRLNAVNSGTVNYDALTFVEPLPTPGDRMLATGGPRGSTFRPAFDPAYGVKVAGAPDGTEMSWEVTTSPDVCVGTGSASEWPNDPTCDTHPGDWTASTAFTGDWTAVTGIRVTLDFRGVAGGSLVGGQGATITYRTLDLPATASRTDGAPVSTSAPKAYAWNQFGAVADLTGGGSIRRAPVKAGVTIATGPLRIDKVLTGAAASAAPDEFTADVVCTVAGAPVDLGAAAHSVLSRNAGFTARIDGIPVGADCTVAEAGAAGSYGEAARSIDNPELHIAGGAVDGVVPSAQVATITNSYEYGRLAIAKTAAKAIVGMDEAVEYTIAVSNIGALDATGFEVTDTLPAGATFVSADQGGTEKDGVVTWPIASLAKNATVELHVVVSYSTPGQPVNRATVTTPPVGPWQPPEVDGACTDDPTASCAPVVVDPPVDPNTGGSGHGGHGDGSDPHAGGGALASTGSTADILLVGFWAGLLALAGAALVARRRRA